MEREGKCCFCGKSYTNYGNDIRPLVNTKGDRCCDECNMEIVIPNRLKFWTHDYFYCIYDTQTGKYIGELQLPVDLIEAWRFKDDALANHMAAKHENWIVKRILLREDN